VKVALAVVIALVQAGSSDAVRAYREGRWRDAHAQFQTVLASAGESASAVLCHDAAIAAWRAGDLRAAELSIERAARADAGRFAGLRDALLGNLAFGRAEIAAAQAAAVESEPFALDLAIGYAESAQRLWSARALAEPSDAAALRNAERATILLSKLRADRAAREDKAKQGGKAKENLVPPDQPQPQPDSRTEGSSPPEAAPVDPARIAELLLTKEREKDRRRAVRRDTKSKSVEQDW
jgi:hypothetical protein